jgi:AcrR family transcriptional regulator
MFISMNERQEKIIDAASALFLGEGVAISTANIAKAARVSNGTLFNALATKQDLVDAIYRNAKHGMFAALIHSGSAPFDRAHLHRNWQGYLNWALAHPQDRDVMHLLLDAGLVSAKTRAAIDKLAAPHGAWVQSALDRGVIRGPSVAFIGRLIFFQLDLVITENLERADADLAFDMLCNSIGLTK